MRGPSSRCSLRATSDSLLALLLFVVLGIVASPAHTGPLLKSSSRHHPRQQGQHTGNVGERSSFKISNIVDATTTSLPTTEPRASTEDVYYHRDKLSSGIEINGNEDKGTSGKSSINSPSATSSRINEASSKVNQEEGIRRFDAVVLNEETLGKIIVPSNNQPKWHDATVENLEIDKTVRKGIIVRDDVSSVNVEKIPAHHPKRQRSARSAKLSPTDEIRLIDETRLQIDNSTKKDVARASEIEPDSANSRQVPILIPVGSSRAESFDRQPIPERVVLLQTDASDRTVERSDTFEENLSKAANLEESSKMQVIESAIVENIGQISESKEPRDESNARVVTEVVTPEDDLTALEKETEQRANSSARKSLAIEEGSVEGDASEESDESEENEDEEDEVQEQGRKEERRGNEASSPSAPLASSLPSILKTNVSLESLKAQAFSLQKIIKNQTSLQRLLDYGGEEGGGPVILPEVPQFTEKELLDVLSTISASKKSSLDLEYSSLSKIDTSRLTENQLKIVRCAEALVVREQRQTFAENMLECVRGLSILNCMRIFVWPIIADNIPASIGQNLPTLPIEVNAVDWLAGNRKEDAENSKPRSSPSLSPHRRTLVTPELVVSNILKEALGENPASGAAYSVLPTFIDPANETFSKLLTIGQLDILKMAERLLPGSARREYSDRMYSCVRRFEYFSCVKYFAWPMVKQHYPALPKFPDYQSWYPSVALYPGYPIVPYPNAEDLGELPEVVEADATRIATGPRPEAAILETLVNILKEQTRKVTNFPTTYSAVPILQSPVSPDQIFSTAEQLIPVPMRPEFVSKTIKCIRDYDYLICAKYSTWPTIRQLYPGFPGFPDLSSWIPTFALPDLPDFSEYIPDFGSYFPTFPGFPGQSTPQPESTTISTTESSTTTTTTTTTPATSSISESNMTNGTRLSQLERTSESLNDGRSNATNLSISGKEDSRPPQVTSSIENRIIRILSNIGWTTLLTNTQQIGPIYSGPGEGGAVLSSLTHDQLRILGLSKSVIPPQVRADFDARLVGCLQGGSDFLTCARNVVWPTLRSYVKDMPIFPQEEKEEEAPAAGALPETIDIPTNDRLQGLNQRLVFAPGIYQPTTQWFSSGIAGRSPVGAEIVAEYEPSSLPIARATQSAATELSRQDATKKSEVDPSVKPVISITGTRFTPIFSDHPETVLLKILTTIESSSKLEAHDTNKAEIALDLEPLDRYLNPEEESIIRVSHNLLPDRARPGFAERISDCAKNSNFIVCSRDIVWPTLAQYYPRLPSFPHFRYDHAAIDKHEQGIGTKPFGSDVISETDVKTGQHGDAMVTITDTRFVPLYGEHPEESILGILKNLRASLPFNHTTGASDPAKKSIEKTSQFSTRFTNQQNDIITVAENLLPEPIRPVFNARMAECVKENDFLDCTRDIAWPTIAQFFPRLPNFPNVGAGGLPGLAVEEEPGERATSLLPPQLEPAVVTAKPERSPAPPPPPPMDNIVPVTLEDLESRIESTLRRITSSWSDPRIRVTYLGTNDPVVGSILTERQVALLRMSEDLLPNSIKPIFVGKMLECARLDVFSNCVRNVGWPTLRQYAPNVPEFPDIAQIGSYFPQVPQEIPQTPQFPDYQQLPQLPNFPTFGLPGGFGYPFFATRDRLSQETSIHVGQAPAVIREEQRDGGGVGNGPYLRGIQELTPSVDSSPPPPPPRPSSRTTHSGTVSRYPSQSTDRDSVTRSDLNDDDDDDDDDESSKQIYIRESVTSKGRRERRSIAGSGNDRYDPSGADSPHLNLTDSEFLELLVDLTNKNGTKEGIVRDPEDYFVERLNSTIKDALSDEQLQILKIVEDINSETAKAGFMSKVVQCVRSLSFVRCMGIFVWPMITQSFGSLVENINPLLRKSTNEANDLRDILGITGEEFERELLTRKEKTEGILMDWYRGLVEEKFQKDYGFVRIRGYGDGQIGISFDGFERTGRVAKIKDNKNLPSILTIISDIMEDVLDQRDSSPRQATNDRKKGEQNLNKVRNEGGRRRAKNLSEGSFLVDYRGNTVSSESESLDPRDSERSDNDDKIITMFLDKLRPNGGGSGVGNEANNYLFAADPYEAFELLFGTRLRERMAERLGDRRGEKNSPRESVAESNFENEDIRTGLVLRLPRVDEELFVGDGGGGTCSFTDLGRKMKMEMSQIVPGITFVLSFMIQVALAHARAAASVAGMMSNMALGSAMLSMLRHSLFGPMTHPKVKYVYDSPVVAPGVTWPLHNHHG